MRTCFWKSLSCNIAFFCFAFVFLLTSDTSRDEALAASFSDNWLAVIEPRALATFAEISPFITMKFIDFVLALFFIQGLLSVPERFMLMKWIGFESALELKWVFSMKSRWGVNELWGLWYLGGLLTFIKKSLFVDNSHAFLYFTENFFGNVTFNDKLKFYWMKKKLDWCSPAKVWSNLNISLVCFSPLS